MSRTGGLAADAVDVAHTPPIDPADLEDLLLPGELERLFAVTAAADRARFATGRSLSRLILSRSLGCAAGELTFDVCCRACGGPHGKPRALLGGEEVRLHTSISHAGEWVLVAIATRPVGIDVELRSAVGFDGFDAVALTAAERRSLRRRPSSWSRREQSRADAWAQKEALLKLHGVRPGRRRPAAPSTSASRRADRVVDDPLDPGGRLALARVDAGRRSPRAGSPSTRRHARLGCVDGRQLLAVGGSAASLTQRREQTAHPVSAGWRRRAR